MTTTTVSKKYELTDEIKKFLMPRLIIRKAFIVLKH